MDFFHYRLLPANADVSSFYQERKNFTTDSGFDLFCPETIIVPARSQAKIDFGIRGQMKDFDTNIAYWLLPRSSICKTPLRMSNSMGLIDSEYRGPICAFVDNLSDQAYVIEKGVRLFQIAAPSLKPFTVKIGSPNDTTFLSSTERGEGGFGSTGTN